MPKPVGTYPPDWPELARAVKEAVSWQCIRCGHPHDPSAGYTLTVHHLTNNKSDRDWWALLALCQRCHLSVQARVDLARPWVWEHSAWFQPYVAGWYAHFYLGEDLSRAEVEARLDELVALERQAVLGE